MDNLNYMIRLQNKVIEQDAEIKRLKQRCACCKFKIEDEVGVPRPEGRRIAKEMEDGEDTY